MQQININHEKIEMIVIISLIIIGIVMGIVFYYDEKKDISAVMLSIALASILYRFLGGIGQQNSLAIGFLKLSGSAAVLFGFIYGLDQFIFVNEKPDSGIKISPDKGWIPIDIVSGKVTKVSIEDSNNNKHEFPTTDDYKQKIKKHEYTVYQERTKFKIVGTHTNDTIGYTKINNWIVDDIFQKIQLIENEDSYRFTLIPDGPKSSTKSVEDVKELPFEIQVFGNARYKILIDDSVISSKIVMPKTGKLIPIPKSKKVYMAYIEQANFMPDTIENYSKWFIVPLEKKW